MHFAAEIAGADFLAGDREKTSRPLFNHPRT